MNLLRSINYYGIFHSKIDLLDYLSIFLSDPLFGVNQTMSLNFRDLAQDRLKIQTHFLTTKDYF